MKRRIWAVLFAICVCAGMAAVPVAEEGTVYAAESGDFKYENMEDGTIRITSYTGNEENVEIPSMLDGKVVTSIGDFAFHNCGSLSVTIPSGVTSIGIDAFYECNSLISVTIPESMMEIGGGAFMCCKSLTSVIIPGSVTSIADSMFWNCENLTSVIISDGVGKICGGAFWGCNSLKSITIPPSVTEIDYMATNILPPECEVIFFSGTTQEWWALDQYGRTGKNRLVHCSDEDLDFRTKKDMGGILFQPGLSCTVNDFRITVTSVEDGWIGVRVKNNSRRTTDMSISYKCYKDNYTLLKTGNFYVDELNAGENYETDFGIPDGTTIVIFGNGTSSGTSSTVNNPGTSSTVNNPGTSSGTSSTVNNPGTSSGTSSTVYNPKPTQSGTTSNNVKVNLKKPAVTSKKAKAKAFTVKWKKVSGAYGYELRYSLKSNMKNAKKITIYGKNNISSTVKKLKAKKNYYIQVRAYCYSSGKTVYSSWSKKVSVKTKR